MSNSLKIWGSGQKITNCDRKVTEQYVILDSQKTWASLIFIFRGCDKEKWGEKSKWITPIHFPQKWRNEKHPQIGQCPV